MFLFFYDTTVDKTDRFLITQTSKLTYNEHIFLFPLLLIIIFKFYQTSAIKCFILDTGSRFCNIQCDYLITWK